MPHRVFRCKVSFQLLPHPGTLPAVSVSPHVAWTTQQKRRLSGREVNLGQGWQKCGAGSPHSAPGAPGAACGLSALAGPCGRERGCHSGAGGRGPSGHPFLRLSSHGGGAPACLPPHTSLPSPEEAPPRPWSAFGVNSACWGHLPRPHLL